MARNCIADMPKDIKWKVVDHAHITSTSVDDELFAFTFNEAYDDRFVNLSHMVLGSKGSLNQNGRRNLHGNSTHTFILIILHIHLLHSFTYFIQGVTRLKGVC